MIKYVLDTKNLGVKIEPMVNSNEPWEIVSFSNSDYAGDPVSRRSTSGFILYVLGVSVLAIKITEKCITVQLRGRVCSLI